MTEVERESEKNPYQSPRKTAVDFNRNRRWSHPVFRILWWLVFTQPFLSIFLIYLSWTCTSLFLGRPPNFGEQITGRFATLGNGLQFVAALSVVACPILVPIGFIWSLNHPFAQFDQKRNSTKKRIACLLCYAFGIGFFSVIRSLDPFRAIYWLMD